MDAMGLIWGISLMILKEVGMTFGSYHWAVLVFPWRPQVPMASLARRSAGVEGPGWWYVGRLADVFDHNEHSIVWSCIDGCVLISGILQ